MKITFYLFFKKSAFFGHVDKRLDEKVKFILKICDVKTWIRHNKDIIVYDMRNIFL